MNADRARAAFAELAHLWPAQEVVKLSELTPHELVVVCELVLELGCTPLDSETLLPVTGRTFDEIRERGDEPWRRPRRDEHALDIGATATPARPAELDAILSRLGSPKAQPREGGTAP